jgi:PRC-barrel domain protein
MNAIIRDLPTPSTIALAVVKWAAPRLAIYLIAVAVTAAVFFGAAAVYAFFWSAPVAPERPAATSPVREPPIELQKPVELPTELPTAPSVPTPRPRLIDLIAGPAANEAPPSIGVSAMFGLEIYGPNEEKVGKVAEVIIDRHGSVESVVLGLEGGLSSALREGRGALRSMS